MSPRRKTWSFSAGEYPNTVRVFERVPGGPLYAAAWDPAANGGKGRIRRISLKHREQDVAIAYAEDEARKLRDGADALVQAPTIGFVTMQYLMHRTPAKAKAVQLEDERRARMWRRVFGMKRPIRTLGRAEWESFIRLRSSGAIDAQGCDVVEADRRPVGPRTVDADLVFLIAVFNWATTWTVKGQPLLEKNPWGGSVAGVKRALERPKSLEVKRPIATFDRFLKVRAAAELVRMWVRKDTAGAVLTELGRAQFKHGEGPVQQWTLPSYLPELLDLVEDTGRRITAICRLRYSDLRREGGKVTKIYWRPMKGSQGEEVPLGERARAAVERILKLRPGIGDRPLFPSAKQPDRPITRHLARDWLEAAEDLAGLEHISGGDFHPYRRAWATVRKHHADADVMKAGGWKDLRSLKGSYQLADDESVQAVIQEPKKLVERKA